MNMIWGHTHWPTFAAKMNCRTIFLFILFTGASACTIGDNRVLYSRLMGSNNGGTWYLSINEPATCSGSINDYDVSFFSRNLNSGTTYNVTLSIWKKINSTTYEKDASTEQLYSYTHNNNRRRKRATLNTPTFSPAVGVRKGSVIGVYLDNSNPLPVIGLRIEGACITFTNSSSTSTLSCTGENYNPWIVIHAEANIAAVNCSTPPNVYNATYVLMDNDTEYGARVMYNCTAGYNLIGADIISCQLNGNWSLPTPSCSLVNCGDPGAPVNGYTNGSVFTYQSIVQYYCNEGYQLSGNSSAQCTATSDWNVTLPNCTLVNCEDPGIPDNGTRIGNNFYYNSTITYNCNIGYNLTGTATLTCLSSGTWSASMPTCPLVNCGDPGTPNNGMRNGDTFTYDSSVSFQCNSGYTILGSISLTCLSNGLWNASVPSCVPDCTDPGVPTNGQRSGQSYSYNSVVTFSCNTGYTLTGANSLICLSSGSWNETVPTCNPVDCGDPGTPSNGAKAGTSFTYNSIITYSCNVGYNVMGADSLTCLSNGSWNGSLPSCVIVSCSDPGTPSNGQRIEAGFLYNSVISYNCETGYNLTGSETLLCLSNGMWNATAPSCSIITCNDPGTPSNGQRIEDTFNYSSTVTFYCNTGYNLTGSLALMCLSSGLWNDTTPSCNKVNCGDPGVPINGQKVGDTFTYLETVTFSCVSDDYSLIGSSAITCQSNGSWSDTVPVCSTHSDCTDPGIPANGVRIGNDFSYNSSVSFSCYPGYQLNGIAAITCDVEGKWNSTNLPSCDVIYCSAPVVPANGNVSYTSLSANSSVYFTCNTGYKSIGNTNITCLSNGQWSNASVPSCNFIECPPLIPPSHGHFTPPNQYTYGTVVTFSCDPGYDLVGMSTTTCIDDGQWSADTPQCKVTASSSTSTTSSDLHVSTSITSSDLHVSTSTTSVQLSTTSQTLTSSIKKTSSVVALSTSQSTTSTTSVMPTSSAEDDDGSTVIIGAAVGAVLFVILLLIVAILLIVLFVTRSKRKSGNLDITSGDTSVTNPILFSNMYDSVAIRSKQAATTTCKDSQLSDYDNTLDPKHQIQSQSASLPYEADADALYTQLDDIETEGENRYPIEEIYDTGDVANMVLPPPLYLDDEAEGVPNSLYFIQEEDVELEKEAPPQGAEAMYFTLDEDAVKGSKTEAVESTDGGGNQAPVYFTLENERKTVPKFSSKKLAKRYTVAFLQPGDNEDDIYGQIQQSSSPMITKESLILSKTIGSGQFGNVCKGQWKKPNGDTIDVAVKMLQDGASEQEKIKFLQEAAIMSQFNNSNVIKLHGVVHDEISPMIVIEYMPKGDLFGVLQKMRPDPGELVHQNTPQILLSFCQQVCLGMTYLSSKGFVHRDLAARNILVSADNVCKIIDFGLSRELEDENYYVSRKGAMIPVKWTAPEALNYRKYSTASDVWSYGCLMYEIWSIGRKPYEDDSNMTALRKITGSERLPPPPGCPEAIYSLMISCWHPVAVERPSFHDIMVSLLQPNKTIMKIPESALSSHPQAGTLGGSLKAGENMYPELQHAYTDAMDTAL